MKPKIHPEFHKVTVSCACGHAFETMCTSKELKVDVCSACHPFYTGTQRFLDTAGRVEKFKAKIDAQQKAAAERPVKAKPVRAVKNTAGTAKPEAPVQAAAKKVKGDEGKADQADKAAKPAAEK